MIEKRFHSSLRPSTGRNISTPSTSLVCFGTLWKLCRLSELSPQIFSGIVLPRIPRHQVLEDIWQLEPRASALACVNERTSRSSLGSVDLISEKYITLDQRDLDIQHQKQKFTSKPQHTKKSCHHLRENRYLEINFFAKSWNRDSPDQLLTWTLSYVPAVSHFRK